MRSGKGCFRLLVVLVTLSSSYPVTVSSSAQSPSTTDGSTDEKLLHEHRLSTEGPALVKMLRDRIPSPERQQQFRQLVSRLNAATYPARSKATADLIQMGPIIRPLVETHIEIAKADPETASRLRHVLGQFPADVDNAIVAATARLIARDKPANSLSALLDYIPYVTDEMVRQELQEAINVVAFAEKMPSPLVMTALKDANPAKNAAAGEALLRTLGLMAKTDVAPLLSNPHPLVQYQLGMALIEKHDKSGLPLVIQSLSSAPPERVEHALGLLYRAAGDDAPSVVYRGKPTVTALSDAWMKWYGKHQQTLDLAKALTTTEHGYTVIACTAFKANTKNKVFELGTDNAVRWEFDGPRYPIDMQIIAPNRVLIAEYFDRRVTERDFQGNLLKQFSVTMPIACQRLPNGHTFIANRQQLMIVDRDGKEVFTCFQQVASITTAQRLKNGQMVVVAAGGRCHLLDAQGRELKSFQMAPIYTLGGNIEVLPNGRILAPQYTQNCVVEYDWQGNKLWQANINRPISVSRLPNGHTLVTCSLDYRIVELDATGKEVWSFQTEGRPFRARRR